MQIDRQRSDFAWLHGRALVARGRAEEGLREMREAAHSADALGLRSGLCGFHHHHAQACREVGQTAQAIVSAEAGITLAERMGGHMVLPGLLTQRAEMLFDQDKPEAATRTLREAISGARESGSVFFELLALATAQRQRSPAADPARLRQLLVFYEGDTSPRIAAIRETAGK